MAPEMVCFGETLWDVFPDRKHIGGAPLNVASRLTGLGASVTLITRVGKDPLGERIKRYLKENRISGSCVQTDPEQPTGIVSVDLDPHGSATYEIKYPVAWDRIEMDTKALKKTGSSSVFVYGSLSSRDPVGYKTLTALLEKAAFKVFDLNLRPPHYSKETIFKLLEQADLLKINDEELAILSEWYGIDSTPIESRLKKLSALTSTPSVCLTLGNKGAVLLSDNSIFKCKGFKIEVADTVGAGDSFLAGLIFQLMADTPKMEALRFACALGALVAGKKGANPKVHYSEIESLLNSQK